MNIKFSYDTKKIIIDMAPWLQFEGNELHPLVAEQVANYLEYSYDQISPLADYDETDVRLIVELLRS